MKTTKNKLGLLALLGLLWTSSALSNDIYIEQSGDNLTLSVTQEGTGNEVGNSTTGVSITGDDMNLTISQVGNTNTVEMSVTGDNYTGNIDVTGSSNTVTLNCDSVGSGNCGTVTNTLTLTGNSNTLTLNVGETNDASDSNITYSVTGSSNTITGTVDGTNVTASTTISGSTNTHDVTISGGGVSGHSLTHSHTGGLGSFTLNQSGINDTTVNLTTSGNNHNVTVTVTD